MELKVETLESNIPLIHLFGRLDIDGVQAIDLKFTAYTSSKKQSVIVDLSQVTFVGSIGIRLLLSNAHALRAEGAGMILLKPQSNVEDVLKLAALDSIMPIAHNMEEAIKLVRSPA